MHWPGMAIHFLVCFLLQCTTQQGRMICNTPSRRSPLMITNTNNPTEFFSTPCVVTDPSTAMKSANGISPIIPFRFYKQFQTFTGSQDKPDLPEHDRKSACNAQLSCCCYWQWSPITDTCSPLACRHVAWPNFRNG
eukprot:scpid6971/ scgid25617/ 